jgi:hypothetical protein
MLPATPQPHKGRYSSSKPRAGAQSIEELHQARFVVWLNRAEAQRRAVGKLE